MKQDCQAGQTAHIS